MQEEKRVDFHCNAFIDFCIQANPEEIRWLNHIFGNNRYKTRTKFDYRPETQSVRFRIAHGDRFYTVYRGGNIVGGFISDWIYRIIYSYPWTLRNDQSASILTRDVLLCIYDRLKNPRDMRAFMQVNKMFYYAGCMYQGYEEKMKRLKKGANVERLPFSGMIPIHRRFFALSLSSMGNPGICVEQTIINLIFAKKDDELFDYCFNLSGMDLNDREIALLQDDRIMIGRGFLTFLHFGSPSSKFSNITKEILEILKNGGSH